MLERLVRMGDQSEVVACDKGNPRGILQRSGHTTRAWCRVGMHIHQTLLLTLL